MNRFILASLAALAVAGPASAANEFEGALRNLADGELAGWVTDSVVIDAIRAQNAAHDGLSPAEIETLDQAWRAEVGASAQPMIEEVMARPASAHLIALQEGAMGLVTEVFVTDALGLNVAQSGVTSDFWQGDEAKFTETFGKAAGTVHLGDIELDESTQTYQSQVSLPVNDPDTGAPIGAVTFGINLELLN